MEGKSGWFSPKELAYLRDPKSVKAKHRSTVRDRIESKVNEEAIYDLERFPDLVEYLDQSTMESFRLQTEPAHAGRGLGAMYPDQLPDIVYGLLLSEKEPAESTDEFVERFDSIWEDIGSTVRHQIRNTQMSFELRQLFKTFRIDLLEKLSSHVTAAYELWDVKMRIPVREFVEWIVNQKDEATFEYLPELLDSAFGISTDEPLPRRFSAYWEQLSEAAQIEGIDPPNDEGWEIDIVDSSDSNYELHEAALSALEAELYDASSRFWEETKLVERDQLLALGLYTHAQLRPRDREIFDQIPCSNAAEGWTRYDTRRANGLAQNRDPPVLTREVTTRRGTDEKYYEFTEYGRFVSWLTTYVEQKATLQDVTQDFAMDAPVEVVERANNWVTDYIDEPRRFEMSADGEGGSGLSNSILWHRALRESDTTEGATQ